MQVEELRALPVLVVILLHVDRHAGRGGFRRIFDFTHNITSQGHDAETIVACVAGDARLWIMNVRESERGRLSWRTDCPDWFVNRGKAIGKQSAILAVGGGDISLEGGRVAHASWRPWDVAMRLRLSQAWATITSVCNIIYGTALCYVDTLYCLWVFRFLLIILCFIVSYNLDSTYLDVLFDVRLFSSIIPKCSHFWTSTIFVTY